MSYMKILFEQRRQLLEIAHPDVYPSTNLNVSPHIGNLSKRFQLILQDVIRAAFDFEKNQSTLPQRVIREEIACVLDVISQIEEELDKQEGELNLGNS